jgi:hypothetical protein
MNQDKGDFTMSAYEKTSSITGKQGNSGRFDREPSYGIVNSVGRGKARADAGSPNTTEPTEMAPPCRPLNSD